MRRVWFVVAGALALVLLVFVTSRLGPPSITAVSPFGRQGGSLNGYCWGSRGLEPNCGSPAHESPSMSLVMPAPWKFRAGYGSVEKAQIRVYVQETLLLEKEAQVNGREILVDPALPPGTYRVMVSAEWHGKGARSVARSFHIAIPKE